MKFSRLLLIAFSALFTLSTAQAQFEITKEASNQLDQRRAGGSTNLAQGEGTVFSIFVRAAGGGYTTAPAVILTAPSSGSTATATATVAGGVVTGFVVTNPGSGYTKPPAVFVAPPYTTTGPVVTTPQFAGAMNSSAASNAVKPATQGASPKFPSAVDATVPSNPVTTITLAKSTFGRSFSSGVPLYFMGDEIQRPTINFDGAPLAQGQNYWRSKPVEPGETFNGVHLGNLDAGAAQPLISKGSVTVLTSIISSSSVIVSSVPPTLQPGASMLGQRVNLISGTTITLSGNASLTINSATAVDYSLYEPYYYSPHADRVFASQAGRVSVTWVSNLPDTSSPGESTATYKFRKETFAVSSASRKPARKIFWTEKSFDGPLVSIPSGRIVRVNPVYNSFVPAATNEYVPVGSNSNESTATAAEPRTLWYDDQNGPAALHAYNIEGRIFIEYLGSEQIGSNGQHEFLGADIVDIRRVAEVATIDTSLGEKLLPRQGSAEAGDGQLIPRVLFNLAAGGSTPYGTFIRPDGVTDYYAERENLNPDLITINWLETKDASIHFLPAPATPALAINWPKYKRNYTQTWPTPIADYQPINVTNSGSDIMTGPRFTASNLPQLIFQDDPAAQEAEIDSQTQRLIVNFTSSLDKTNRSLLKFTSNVGPWYVRLFIQSEDSLGSPAVPDPDGSGPLAGSPAIYTLNDQNADGIADWSPNSPDSASTGMTTAIVGSRIEPPSGDFELGGYIASGNLYSDAAYINPFVDGVAAAAAGGIIPVNTLPGNDQLKVWWFKKVTPPSSKFEPFYVPAVAARYTIAYPTDPQELVIASNKGLENPSLTSVQAGGSLYVQNDPTLIGYNPNEEHAMMLAGNAYALRDDLNTATSSAPFTLIQYTDPASNRPAMRVAKVVRETATYPLVYDKIAGTPAQPPLPLTALPVPLLADGKTVKNKEVATVPDLPVGADAPATYNGFTFVDRKGIHWIYRGAHDSGTPSFGMKYYYNLRDGFNFPSLDLASQPAVGSIQPFIADVGSGESVTLTYLPKWPDDATLPAAEQTPVGVLQTAETLTLTKAGLPQVRGQSSAQVYYQQSIANLGSTKPAVALHDPTRAKMIQLADRSVLLDKLPASVLTTDYSGKTWFQLLPPHLQNRFYFDLNIGTKGALVIIGEFIDVISGEDYLNLNQLSAADIAELKALCPASDTANKAKWDAAITGLSTTLETFREDPLVPGSYVASSGLDQSVEVNGRSDISDPDTAVDSYALSSTGLGSGYVTLVFNNGKAFTDAGNGVDVKIIKVDPQLYKGDIKVLLASNPLDEQVVLRHSGDYGGQPENFEFEWRYGFSDSGGLPPTLDNPATDPNWIAPSGTLGSSILVGGSPTAVINTPAVLIGDTWFTMRYKKVGGSYSEWMTPVLVEGWIKRVLAKITPFNQRMENLYNTSLNTDVSLLTQAGGRWVGDIALNLDNINEAGLIEIYETVLNRGKKFSIGSGIDFNPSNQALTLAAGYLNDLYTILGNEAFADASNPTISIDDQTTVTEVNTSRFSFEGQVTSSLDEELALLRGRDDFGLPNVDIAPAYNRLFWNYTRGIDSGEVLYAVNYNIKEKAGSPTENGIVDAADAQRMFPQGHGDAYGHYLTALTGYYKLLQHPEFTWSPQAEAVTILGQAVLVDYKDERKFAAAAANLSRTAQQVFALAHRQSYNDDPAAGWGSFRDGENNSRTGVTRHQGLDEWASRSAQGNFYHWVTANALLPDVDPNPNHTGVQIVDRTTVPELNQLVAGANSIQSDMDLANAHLNPLGLSPGAIAFDISPAEHNAGNSHYEQVYGRALQTLLNAKGSFDQAAKMTRLLRNQENQIADQQAAIVDQEKAYVRALKEIYGTPYAGDIGPGKTYIQGYQGPDTENWFIIDQPTDLVYTGLPTQITMRVPIGVRGFTGNALADITSSYHGINTTSKSVTVTPNRFSQFATVIDQTGGLGSRPLTGSLQQSLLDAYLAQVAVQEAHQKLLVLQKQFARESEIYQGLVNSHLNSISTKAEFKDDIATVKLSSTILANVGAGLIGAADTVQQFADAASEGLPRVVGLATDATSVGRSAFKFVAAGGGSALTAAGLASKGAGKILEARIPGLTLEMEKALTRIGFDQDELQAIYEVENVYRELLGQHFIFAKLIADHQSANQRVSNLSYAGQSILTERETFRQRAAAVINGYRTNDLTFRTFRNEALVQYRTLFDLASRYSYLAAKSYDYETGLLGSPAGTAVINRLVASRSLGDLTGGVPQATTSTLGDAGLAGTMAQINADFSVAEGRLGINNPDAQGTLFSLRHELYRILNDPSITIDDAAWQQTLEQNITPNLLADPDVAKHCGNLRKPDGTPVAGIVITFSSTIEHAKNFFGLSFAAGDHNYTPSSFATKISSAGIVLPGYVGMDPYAVGTPNAGSPNLAHADALGATPYVYLIPCGTDYMRAPPLGDTNTLRSWNVADQALPLPYNLGASSFNTTQFFTANGTLSEQPWILRKHQAFRPVSDPAFFYSNIPQEFTNTRLIGRSVWNSQWKIVIPAYSLLNDEQEGLNRFVRSVKDIQLFLRTYSHSGN